MVLFITSNPTPIVVIFSQLYVLSLSLKAAPISDLRNLMGAISISSPSFLSAYGSEDKILILRSDFLWGEPCP
jgi:hypothetical protein